MDYNEEISRRIQRFKEDIDLNDLASWLGMERPKPNGNWRSPHRTDKSPSVSIFKDGRAFKDYVTGDAGSCIDLVMYVRGGDNWDAIKTLHEYRNLPMPSREKVERVEQTKEEFIAAKCLANAELAIPYLTEQRGISDATVRASIKARQIGFNTWTSPRVAPGEPGHGGPAPAFIVRTLNPGHVMAVDMRYVDPDLNGGMKTQTQGPKNGYLWTPYEPRRLKQAKTVYLVESPINALSIEDCHMPFTTALAIRGLTIDEHDWSVLAGKQVVICMDADKANERGERPGPQCAWRLYDALTARKIAAVMVDQSSWAEDGFNDCNDFIKKGGPGIEELKRRMKRQEDHAIAGLPSEWVPGKSRVFLPSYDYAAYWRFRSQADYMEYILERKVNEDAAEDEKKETVSKVPLAGFRLAQLSMIRVQSWNATCSAATDMSPTTVFAATAQVPRHGPALQRQVFRDDELHKPAKWQEFGPVFKPEFFQRLVSIFERTVDLDSRRAANFVGVCYLDGELIVSEGSDCYFEDPNKQCVYADLRFHRGPVTDATKVINAYRETYSTSAALIPLVWILGGPALKCILGFWPHFQMQAEKGSGKSTLLGALGSTTGFKVLSSQQVATIFRVMTAVGHSAMPVAFEEISTLKQKEIDQAMNVMQECYQFTPSTRGSDQLQYLNSAPVMLAGEDVEAAKTLTGKFTRTSLTPTKQGTPIPDNLPPFPMRAWLEWITKKDPAEIRDRYEKMHQYCIRNSSAPPRDAGAKRMTKNYAALLLAWALINDFRSDDGGEQEFGRDVMAEMNKHIVQTVSDREPYIWILEKLASEISARRFMYPFVWDWVEDKTTGTDVPCLVVRAQHVMDHMSSAVHLREWFNGLPVKSKGVFRQQAISGGLVVDGDKTFTFNETRQFHALALSIEAMESKGISMSVPEKLSQHSITGYGESS